VIFVFLSCVAEAPAGLDTTMVQPPEFEALPNSVWDVWPDLQCSDGETFLTYAEVWWTGDLWVGHQSNRLGMDPKNPSCEIDRLGAWRPNDTPHAVCEACFGLTHIADVYVPGPCGGATDWTGVGDIWVGDQGINSGIWYEASALPASQAWYGNEQFLTWYTRRCIQ
jgi:hypothetical protein